MVIRRFFFFKQKTAYEMRISDWSSDVCSSDLLSWGAANPYKPPLATAQATRTGIGGIIGQPRTHFSRRFAIDFVGGSLKTLSREAKVEAAISASRGKLEIVSARPLDAINGWRAMFDLEIGRAHV